MQFGANKSPVDRSNPHQAGYCGFTLLLVYSNTTNPPVRTAALVAAAAAASSIAVKELPMMERSKPLIFVQINVIDHVDNSSMNSRLDVQLYRTKCAATTVSISRVTECAIVSIYSIVNGTSASPIAQL